MRGWRGNRGAGGGEGERRKEGGRDGGMGFSLSETSLNTVALCWEGKVKGTAEAKCVFIHVCEVDVKCAARGWGCEAMTQKKNKKKTGNTITITICGSRRRE